MRVHIYSHILYKQALLLPQDRRFFYTLCTILPSICRLQTVSSLVWCPLFWVFLKRGSTVSGCCYSLSITSIHFCCWHCFLLQVAPGTGWHPKDWCPLPLPGWRGKLQLASGVPLWVPPPREGHGGEEEGALLQSGHNREEAASAAHHPSVGQQSVQCRWIHWLEHGYFVCM